MGVSVDEELSYQVRKLIETANRQGTMLIGFMASLDSDTPLLTFSNVKERGTELARVFREIADIIEDRGDRGLIQAMPLSRTQ